MTGRRARGALVLLLALVLAGCGGLSRSGDVQPGLDVASGNPQGIRVLFPGPAAGVDQVSIVRGFVRAGSASDAAYDNARAFLTAQSSEKWNPDRTLVLVVEEGADRARARDGAASDRIGGRSADYHHKVELAFRLVAAEEPVLEGALHIQSPEHGDRRLDVLDARTNHVE